MTFQEWALTVPNCFAETGSARHLFMVGNGTKAEYIAQFPNSAFGHVYTEFEQNGQWNVILEARKWFKRHYDIFLGIAVFPDPNR
jgi:hypothetical protein